jgi:hypothetical protein
MSTLFRARVTIPLEQNMRVLARAKARDRGSR